MPVYVWTAPGPHVRGGLFHILLTVVPGCFHPEQKALVNDARSTFLAAEVAVSGARGKAIESWATPRSPVPGGVSAALSRRPAAGRMCPVRLT